jgi:antirestriction protein ArdC
MKTSSHIDVYQMVTDLIIEKLEQGRIPWHQSWNNYGPAVNYLSRKPYRGINRLLLSGLHDKPFYLTFKQAADLGGRVKKGARSIPITYWNFVYTDKETKKRLSLNEVQSYPADKIQKSAFLKYYRVFNIDDIRHIEFDLPNIDTHSDNLSIEQCDAVLYNMKDRPEIRHTHPDPYYHPREDYINMPPIERFKSSEMYFSILFHELCHASGHPKRLNRFKDNEINPFNSKSSYSLEELVAEIGAAFLNNHTGILNDETIKDSTAYIQGWLEQLRNDKKFIVEASAKAQKAVDYILNEGS